MKRVFAFIGFSSALTLLLLNTIPFRFAKYFLLSAAILLSVSLLIKNFREGMVIPIVLSAVIFSCCAFIFVVNNTVIPQQSLDGQTLQAEFQIVDIPKKTDYGYSYTVKTKAINKEGSVQNIKLLVSSKHKIKADYYDNVYAILKVKSVSQNAFGSYGRFGDGIFLKAVLYDAQVEENDDRPFNYHIIKLRERIREILTDNLKKDSAGLTLAFLTGDKSQLSDEIINNFRVCGATHIMAVSGFHTAVICMGVYLLMKGLGINLTLRSIITAVTAILYASIADFSKSVIRAVIMLIILLISRIISDKSDALNSLGFAVFILCLNPFAVTDPSAVLTVCAVIGITVIYPRLRVKQKFNKAIDFILDSVAVSFSVLLASMPAVWLLFTHISLMSVFLNVILMPLAELVIYFSLILLAVFKIPFISSAFIFAVNNLTRLIIEITGFCADNFSFLYIDFSSEYYAIAMAFIFLVIGVSLIAFKRLPLKAVAVSAALLMFTSTMISVSDTLNTTLLTVDKTGCIIISNNYEAVIIDADSSKGYYAVKSCHNRFNAKNVYLVNCDYSEERLANLFYSNVLAVNSNSYYNFSGQNISVEGEKNGITVTIYDKKAFITDDYVIYNGFYAYRNIYSKFSENKDYEFIFKKNSNTQLRMIDYG